MTQRNNIEQIKFENEGITIDAEVIAKELGLDPSSVPWHMKEGNITSVCERGVDQDAGQHRLTFFYLGRRLQLIIDPHGRIRSRALIDFGNHPLSTLPHRFK